MTAGIKDLIDVTQHPTLDAAFRERARRSADKTAYIQHDADQERWLSHSWADTAHEVARWQTALQDAGLRAGDRVGIMMHNRWEWVIFDQAALGLGLVTVPLYPNDRHDNIAHVLEDSGTRLLFLQNQDQWEELRPIDELLGSLVAVVTLNPLDTGSTRARVVASADWLPDQPRELQSLCTDPQALFTIIYTSGTTGKPKGVMLSHHNVLTNAAAALSVVNMFADDRLLSFLPLSHALERTAGYYLNILSGSAVAYARSIPQLGEDLLEIKPTVLVSVPRIFERVNTKVQAKLAQDSAIKRRLFALAVRLGWHRFEHEQGRAAWTSGLLLQPLLDRLVGAKIRGRLGGNLRFAVTGGAPMPPEISRIFIGLGITVVQGYGLTETSPMITANHLEDNDPASVGKCVPGQELRIGERDEILTRGPHVMLGYWNNELATRDMIDDDGWLHTGDQGRLDDRGHLFITGRLKEIIILANGENLPPAEMEMTISQDELVEQVLVVGDNRPFLTALVVPDEEAMAALKHQLNLELGEYAVNADTINQRVLERVQRSVEHFPGYAKLMRIALVHEPWTVENGLMTPTMKLKRARILENHQDLVDQLYAGHG